MKKATGRGKARRPNPIPRPTARRQPKAKALHIPRKQSASSSAELRRRLTDQERRIRSLEIRLQTRVKREEHILAALGMQPNTLKPGAETRIDRVSKSLDKLAEQALANAKRMENILTALKNHREFLIKLNRRVYRQDAKERIRIELEVMKNTLSLLALGGYDFDHTIFSEIKRMHGLLRKEDAEMDAIRKRKEHLDKKYQEQVGRVDWENVYTRKKDIPGYG